MRRVLVLGVVATLVPACLLDRLGGLSEDPGPSGGAASVSSSASGTMASAGGGGAASSSSSSGAVGGSTSTTTTTGGGGAGGEPPVLSPCHPMGLEDAFMGASVNTSLWNTQGKQSIMSVQSGRLRVAPEDSIEDAQWVGLVTSAAYDLTGCAVWIEVPNLIKNGAQGETYWQIYSGQGVGRIRVRDGTLEATVTDGGSPLGAASMTYVAASHRWWRIRESNGTLHLEASGDFNTWQPLLAVPSPAYITSITVGLGVLSPSNDVNIGQGEFDNLNLEP